MKMSLKQHHFKILRRKPWSLGTSQGSGNIGLKYVKFVVGSDSIVKITHSLTHAQKNSIVAYAYEAVSYKKWGNNFFSFFSP